MEMKTKTKTKRLMVKFVYLEIPILVLSKTLMYEFWYNYVKPKYNEKAKLHCMDTDSFVVYIKTDDIYKDIAEDVETRLDTLNHELDREIMTKFVGLRVKTCSYLIDRGSEN